jgi:hypothetical protein
MFVLGSVSYVFWIIRVTAPPSSPLPCIIEGTLHLYVLYDFFFYEGPSHHSLKAFCATPMKMIRMSSFLPICTINGAAVE